MGWLPRLCKPQNKPLHDYIGKLEVQNITAASNSKGNNGVVEYQNYRMPWLCHRY